MLIIQQHLQMKCYNLKEDSGADKLQYSERHQQNLKGVYCHQTQVRSWLRQCMQFLVVCSNQSPIGLGPESFDNGRSEVRMRRRFSLTNSGRFLAAPAAKISTIAM